ncbi:hypothetical protein YK48G_04250 [Lentilactobacillus fungorum]|uniref:Single-stranded DNA-binding protein n=1 Tax=Lentilactobacillus fungorum TaxID=2201250 RepID=A0ABQ3VVT9_9LACO|nr:single-stranded DNA-binding protein [Lentilactobacillus fungorum]GHP13000.1 hypothetical protein YK48G_04250 [Lentilactobacillus fungorum]
MRNMSITGNVGQDPTSRQVGNNQVADFSIAVRRNRPNRDGNYGADWVRCSVFGKRSNTVMKYFHRGDNVAVSGQWSINRWTDNRGKDQFGLELNVNDFDLPHRQRQSNQQSDHSQGDPFAGSGDQIDVTDDQLPF